jgi:hypothetical protein
MTTSRFALLVGLVLGVVATFGGFGYLVVVAVFTAVGWGVGLVLEGRLDLRSIVGQATDRR